MGSLSCIFLKALQANIKRACTWQQWDRFVRVYVACILYIVPHDESLESKALFLYIGVYYFAVSA